MAILWAAPMRCLPLRGLNSDRFAGAAVRALSPAEIAADFMTKFYHVQVGALETQEFRTSPVPFWLVCFSDTRQEPRSNR
jgi:hypothetical protein